MFQFYVQPGKVDKRQQKIEMIYQDQCQLIDPLSLASFLAPLDLLLVEESEEDRKLAALIKYKSVENYDERQAKKRKAIEDASVRDCEEARTYTCTNNKTTRAAPHKNQENIQLILNNKQTLNNKHTQ